MVMLTIWGYTFYGLTGTGIALLIVYVFNTLLVLIYMGLRFGARLRKAIFLLLSLQMGIGVTAFIATQWLSGLVYWAMAALLFSVSFCISLNILRRKTRLWERLKTDFCEKIIKNNRFS
jgi:hypothetical protein